MSAFSYYIQYVFALEYQHSDCLETTYQLVCLLFHFSNNDRERCPSLWQKALKPFVEMSTEQKC